MQLAQPGFVSTRNFQKSFKNDGGHAENLQERCEILLKRGLGVQPSPAVSVGAARAGPKAPRPGQAQDQ